MIRVYDLEYNANRMLQLTTNKITGYGKGMTIDNIDEAAQMLNVTFMPDIKAEDCGYMVACDKDMGIIALFITTVGGGMIVKYNARKQLTKALLCNATHILLARNAPNKDYSISESEIGYYQSFKQTASAVGITIIDNLILTKDGYISFKQQGIR